MGEMSFINSSNTEARSVPNVSFDEILDAYRPWAKANERNWKERRQEAALAELPT
jgi:hypothetical protein